MYSKYKLVLGSVEFHVVSFERLVTKFLHVVKFCDLFKNSHIELINFKFVLAVTVRA